MRRPSVLVIGAFWAGLVLAGSVRTGLWIPVTGLGAAVAAMMVTRKPRPAYGIFLLCWFLLGCLRSPEARWNRHGLTEIPSEDRCFPCIVTVSGPPVLGKYRRPVKVKVESVLVGYPWLESGCLLLRHTGSGPPVPAGGGTALGTFYAPRPRLNPYGWDTALRYRREGVAGTLVLKAAVRDTTAGPPVLSRFRAGVRDLIRSAGSERTRGILEALLLGERSDLSPEIRDIMVRAGTYHIIAISGLHVGIVVLLVTSLITAAGPPRVLRIALAVGFVAAYVVLTGARPSAQRAGALFVILSLVRYLQWKVDVPNCVCAAGVGLLAAFPYLAWDVGFRLSLAAVFGLTLFVPQLSRAGRACGAWAKLREYIRLGLIASFSAQAATLPVLLFHFGRVSLMGVVSNLVALPLVTLAVAAGLEASIAGLIWRPLGLVFMKGASALVTLILVATSFLTQHIDPVVFTGRPHAALLVLYAGVLACVGLAGRRIKRPLKLLILAVLYALLVCPFFSGRPRGMVATFIHVGDGDACLVEMEDATLLVDTGAAGEDYDAGRSDILPLLAMRGLKRLDTVLITHSHNDHYGGLASLLDNVEIGQVLIGAPDGEAGYREVLGKCRERGVEVVQVIRGDSLILGGAALEVFHPSEAYMGREVGDPNAQSIVCKLVYGGIDFLFTGDLTPEVQRELMDLGFDLACDVLKVPHHGAPRGVEPAYAQCCGARYAVISAGTRFASHPCPDVVRLLEQSGARTLVTKSHGAVTVVTDGQSLEVRTEVLGPVDAGLGRPQTSLLDEAGGR